MRPARLLLPLLAALTLIAPASAQQSAAPSVVANVSDPWDADTARFSPDGRVLAVTGYRNDLTLWDLSSGLPIRTLPERASVTGAVFTNDGKRMLTGHKDGAVRLWDMESGAVLYALRARPRSGDSSPAAIIGLSIDGKGEHIITTEFGPAATVWNVPARKLLYTVPRTDKENLGASQSIAASRLSADGRRLIVVAAKDFEKLYSATIFDAKTGAELSHFDLPKNIVAVDDGFVSDDEIVVLVSNACESGEFKLFSLHRRAVVAPVYRPANCSKPKDGRERSEPRLHTSPESRRIAISKDGDPDVAIYDTAVRRMERTLRLPIGPKARVVGVSRDLARAAVADTGGIAIHALDAGASVKTLRSFTAPAGQSRIGPDGTNAISWTKRAAGDSAAHIVGIRRLDQPQGAAFTVALPAGFTLDDVAAAPRLALARNDTAEILLLSLDGKAAPRRYPAAPLTSVVRARLSPDGTAAVLDGRIADGSVKPGDDPDDAGTAAIFLLDLATGKVTQVDTGNADNDAMSVAFSADGARFALGMRDGSARIFEAQSGRLMKTLPSYARDEDGDAGAIGFSTDATLLAGGATFDDKVFVWDAGAAKLIHTITLPDSLAGYRIVTAAALSHDRKTLAAGLGQRAVSSGDIGRETGGIYLFDLATGKLRHALRGHTGAIAGLSFSRDDRHLVSASHDGTVRTWERATGKPLATAAMDAQGRFAVVTEAGFYAAPEGGDDVLSIVRGSRAISGAAARATLARPELVETLLKGDPDGKYRAAAKTLDWPKLLPAR